MTNFTKETLDLIKTAQQNPDNAIAKTGWTQSTGLTYYDLQAPAKLLFPVVTPLRNSIPRVKGRGDIATRWKSISALNSGNVTPGVSEMHRGALLSTTVNNLTATYKFLGLEDQVSFEADLAAEGFDDAKARAAQGLLLSMMIEEERMMLGGNCTTSLGTPVTPTASASTGASTFTSSTQSVIVVALTLDGYRRASISGGLVSSYSQVSSGPYSNTDAHSGGISKKSSAASQAVTGSTQVLNMSTTPINGAVAYAWFWGVSGSELLGAITTTASNVATGAATGTQNASAISSSVDNSTDALGYDGLLGIVASNSGTAYYNALTNGNKLTSDGGVGINEINTALKVQYDSFKTGPTKIWVSSQEVIDINSLILKATGAPLVRFNTDMNGSRSLTANSVVGNYFNPFMNELIAVEVHPNMPQGTIVLVSDRMPPQFYQYSNVGSPIELHYRRDYYQIDWPQIQRSYEMGVYNDAVLACYFPAGFGVIANITHL